MVQATGSFLGSLTHLFEPPRASLHARLLGYGLCQGCRMWLRIIIVCCVSAAGQTQSNVRWPRAVSRLEALKSTLNKPVPTLCFRFFSFQGCRLIWLLVGKKRSPGLKPFQPPRALYASLPLYMPP